MPCQKVVPSMIDVRNVLKEEESFLAMRETFLLQEPAVDKMESLRDKMGNVLMEITDLLGPCTPGSLLEFRGYVLSPGSSLFASVIKSGVVPTLVVLLDTSTPEPLLTLVLTLLECMSEPEDTGILSVFFESQITNRLPCVFTYASRRAEEIHWSIAHICWNIVRQLSNSMELNLMNECFFQQATMWADGSSNSACRECCLLFMYHVVVETEPPRIDQLTALSEVCICSITPFAKDVVPLACTILRHLMASGEFLVEEIAFDIFSRTWSVMDQDCVIPCLKLQIEVLREMTEVPNILGDVVQWESLVEMMTLSGSQIHYLACCVLKYLVCGGPQFIQRLLVTKFLEAAYSIYKNNTSYKGLFYLTECIGNILLNGHKEQQVLILSHPVFVWMLDFLVSADGSAVKNVLRSVQWALQGNLSGELLRLFEERKIEDFIVSLSMKSDDPDVVQVALVILEMLHESYK